MMSDPILSTLSKLVSLYDGVAEPDGDNQMMVLLSANIAKQLHLPEEVTLSTKADVPDSVFVTYHSELLSRFSSLLGNRGSVSAIAIDYDGYLKTTGFEKQLLQTLKPQNGLIRFLEAKPETTRYLWCHVAYTAEADEKRVGMVSFIINELTQVARVEIGNALFWESDRLPVEHPEAISERSVEEISNLIERTSAQLVQSDLENWLSKLARAKARDEDRLKIYYNTINQEINNRIQSRHLEGEDKEKELARMSATNKELERKLADLQERYALKVEASLYSVMVIHLPTVHIQCELVRKKIKRIVTAVWNPFTKLIEPLRCERSGVPVYEFYLDDTNAQIIAATTWNQKS
ncbi:MAG: hypothetical protein SAK29_12085 [Scytonema sp. PMC 1069.18]|nr:hypothetical protein [Scytonema sp. PMC 1069.18]MEC4883300.1 hypothetical protein [Scytonema sp. PMC 1070.18]